MKSANQIKNEFNVVRRTGEGIESMGGDFYVHVDILDNQKLLLEVLLDIRDILIKMKTK